MALLPILEFPNDTLTTPTAKVGPMTPALNTLVSDMVDTMRSVDGLGLAAPQVGHGIRLTVIEYRPSKGERKQDAIPLMVLINPKIISKSRETDRMDEGCLSLPGIEVAVPRSTKIKVRMDTQDGKTVQFRATGLLARIIQHELDHLDGLLIIDRCANREAALKAYESKRPR